MNEQGCCYNYIILTTLVVTTNRCASQYLVASTFVDWVTLCECVDVNPAGHQKTDGTWVVVVEVDIVECTVDVFSGCHTCGAVSCGVHNNFIICKQEIKLYINENSLIIPCMWV